MMTIPITDLFSVHFSKQIARYVYKLIDFLLAKLDQIILGLVSQLCGIQLNLFQTTKCTAMMVTLAKCQVLTYSFKRFTL